MTETTTPVPKTPEVDAFDWSARNSDVLATYQPALAVYRNDFNHLVIRGERGPFDDEDIFILVSIENAPKLIARLNKLLEELSHAA
jgi:hypothetical protein